MSGLGSPPLHVAFVSHNDHLRMGGQRSMALLIEHLDRSRIRPLAIVPRAGELSRHLEGLDCPVAYVALHKIKPRTLPGVWRSIRALRRLFAERRVDVVIPDAARDALVCGLAKLGTRTKMIWFMRLTSRDTLDRINQALADAMMGDSDDTKRRLSPRARARHRTIVGGVDPKVFRPVPDRSPLRQRLGLPEERFVLLYAGQIREQKGVLDILDGMALLARELPPARVPLLVVAGTPVGTGIMDQIGERVAAAGLGDHVRVLPQQQNIHEWMQAADAFVSGSHEHTEGMSRVLYEAMACGAAVIGTDVAGNRDALTPESGILVPQKSPAEIARAVRRLVEDPERRAAYQTAGVRRARESFDIARHAREVERFCLEVAGR